LFLLGNNFTDISSLSTLTNMRNLSLGDNQSFNGDISVFRHFENLTHLFLASNFYDLTPIKYLTSLEHFSIWARYQLLDLSYFTNPERITHLSLVGANVHDYSLIKYFTNLIYLSLQHNQINNISFLRNANFTNLITLSLWNNEIVDLTPLQGLTNLETLGIGNNMIVDVSPLSELANLTWLFLGDNMITDISSLRTLGDLFHLDLEGNMISIEQVESLYSETQSGWLRIIHTKYSAY